MKKVCLLATVLFMGVFCMSCGGSGGSSGTKITPPADSIGIGSSISDNNNTYSLSSGIGVISFTVGIIQNGSAVHPNPGEVIWTIEGNNIGILTPISTSTGATLVPTTIGVATVKAVYNGGLTATVTITVVA